MIWLWAFLAVATAVAGIRHLLRTRAARSAGAPRVDDDALRRILDTGTLSTPDDEDEPLDLDAAARAEEEFWSQSWDEPEEYPR